MKKLCLEAYFRGGSGATSFVFGLLVLCLLTAGAGFAQESPEASEEQVKARKIDVDEGDIDVTYVDVEAAVKRFTKRALEFQEAINGTVDQQYNRREGQINEKYEEALKKFEKMEMSEILNAIEKFKAFIKRFPREKKYTPDAMFRLAELYYQKAKMEYDSVREDLIKEYERRLKMFDEGEIDSEPKPPHPDFTGSIALYNRIANEFADYRYIDSVFYMMAYGYQERGDLPAVRRSFENLIASRPDSKYVAEAYLRIGDAFFNEQNYEDALLSLQKANEFKDSILYDQILYKLASTHFILNQYSEAVRTFARLNDFSEEMLKKEDRHSYFRDESVKYIAFCYAQSAEYWADAGVDSAKTFMAQLGDRPWEADVFRELGDYFFQQAKWRDAAESYKMVLKKDPWAADSPQLQDKIITIYWRGIKDEDQMNIERERLVEDYGEGSKWASHNSDNPEAVEAAAELALNSLKQWATFQHIQAYKYRQMGQEENALVYYRRASEAYKKFLDRFPHDKEAYELTFRLASAYFYTGQYENAVLVYLKVRDDKQRKEHFSDAAYQVVLCYWNMIGSEEGRLTQSDEEAAKQQRERLKEGKAEEKQVPELKQKYIDAADLYVAKVKDPKEKEVIAWNSAEIMYEYDHLEVARGRYIDIVNNFPKSEFAPKAANRIIDTYTLVKDWVKVTEWSERLASLEIGGTEDREKMRARLMFVKGNAMAQYAMELEERKEWEKAAEQYLKAVAQDPKGKDAPKMVYNAAAMYTKAKRPAKAMDLFQRIVDEYPDAEFAAESLYFVAENAYDSFNLDQASSAYVRLYTEYPNIDPKRKCLAVYNHAQLEEFNHAYKTAARVYEKYVDQCEVVDKNAPIILFRAGEIFEKQRDWKNMERIYKSFIDRYGKKTEHKPFAIQAIVKIGQSYFTLRQKPWIGLKYYKQAIEFFKANKSLETDALSNQLIAQAEFELVEIEYEKYKKIKISGNSQKKLAESFKLKEKRMLEMVDLYTKVKNYRSKEYFLAASFRSGEVIEFYADSLFDAPLLIPKEIKRAGEDYVEEFKMQYEQQMYDLASPYYKQAVDMYMKTLEDGRKTKMFGSPWMKRLFQALNRPNVKPHVVGDIKLRKPEKPHFRQRVTLPLPLDNGQPREKVKPKEEEPTEQPTDAAAAP